MIKTTSVMKGVLLPEGEQQEQELARISASSPTMPKSRK
jgi:hypothetical protein